ncbi:MAG: protein kinase, partial [Bryobacteraceae bacterium]
GPTLDRALSSGRPLSPELIPDVLYRTAAALDYAHEKGVVHGNIKPANILLTEEGAAKVADFGIAKMAAAREIAQPGVVLGAPYYMAPEQIEGKAADGRTDQFALAVIAYELLTGEKPFASGPIATVLHKIVSEEPLPPHEINPTLGWPVGMVFTRALSKIPAGRYATCTHFAAALDSALHTRHGWQALPRAATSALSAAVLQPGTPAAIAVEGTEARGAPREPHVTFLWQLLGTALGAVAVIALIFLGAQHWVFPEEKQQRSLVAADNTVHTGKPAPFSGHAPSAAPKASPVATPPPGADAGDMPGTRPVITAPVTTAVVESNPGPAQTPQATSAANDPTRPLAERRGGVFAALADQPLELVTNPPGALATLDSDTQLRCKTPCTLKIAPGRHTATFALPGYRQEMRIVDLGGPKEVFVNLTRPAATVGVEGRP